MNTYLDGQINQLKRIACFQDSMSIKQQIELVKKISQYPTGLTQLLQLLIKRRDGETEALRCIDGIIFKHLRNSKTIAVENQINRYFHEGIVKLKSSSKINYKPLYESLASSNFKTANQLTQRYLLVLAGLNSNQKRKWLYFTDMLSLPSQDLETIDTLWRIYSEGRFGFSVQKRIWVCNNRNWEKFWHKIGWKINKKNVRYPSEFTWDISAPTGHLPLFNQLRGVQVLATLFMHPALQDE